MIVAHKCYGCGVFFTCAGGKLVLKYASHDFMVAGVIFTDANDLVG
jgi:hypothetical protein